MSAPTLHPSNERHAHPASSTGRRPHDRGVHAPPRRRSAPLPALIALPVLVALATIVGGCGPGRGGRATGGADGSVDIGGGGRDGDEVVAQASPDLGGATAAPRDDGTLATDTPPAAGTAPATDVPALGAADAGEAGGGNLEIIDVSGGDIESLLDASRTVFFSTGTIESMCDAPELFADRITGEPQIVVSADVRLATRAVVVALGFAPDAAIDVRVADPDGATKAALQLHANGIGCAVGAWIVSPDSPLGDHVVRATDGRAAAELVVPVAVPDEPTYVVTPNDVLAGEDVAVFFAGFEPATRLQIVLYELGRGAGACGKYVQNDCWRLRTRWRTPATSANGSLVVRLPTTRADPRTDYLVTTHPRTQMFPRDTTNPALIFSIVDERRSEAPTEPPTAAPDEPSPGTGIDEAPVEAAPPWLRRLRPERGIRLATPVVAP